MEIKIKIEGEYCLPSETGFSCPQLVPSGRGRFSCNQFVTSLKAKRAEVKSCNGWNYRPIRCPACLALDKKEGK